jgi:hypothetical protein
LEPKFEIFKTFEALLDQIIPAELEFGLLSGSQVGFKLEEDSLELVKLIDEYTFEKYNLAFYELSPTVRTVVADILRFKHKKFFNKIALNLAEYYYTRPEVLKKIGAGESPPFPHGNQVEDVDLSLLYDVFSRGKMYR